ncbi:hypothetical protein PTKIN_Ptkin17bG0029700 [Pterospermum kingtungense]
MFPGVTMASGLQDWPNPPRMQRFRSKPVYIYIIRSWQPWVACLILNSPKLRVYETDFGFGRPRKSEVVHIGTHGSISVAESRDEAGGVEFGLALASAELDKFNAIFEQGLLNLK